MWMSASHSAQNFDVCLVRKCCLLMLQELETNSMECCVTELAGAKKLWLCSKFLNVIALRHKAIPWSREHAQSNENNYRLFHVYRRMLYLNILFYSGPSTYKWIVCAKHNARSNKRFFITHSCSFTYGWNSHTLGSSELTSTALNGTELEITPHGSADCKCLRTLPRFSGDTPLALTS
jgi:hypothetical protein